MEEFITLEEAAQLLKLHRETLRRWDRQGKLEAVKVGTRGDRRYRKVDIEKILLESIPQSTYQTSAPKSAYIQQKVKIHDNFEKAEEDRRKYGFLYLGNEVSQALSDEVVRSRAFLLAEAGYGKTRLLNEAAKKSQAQEEVGVVIDLKLFPQSKYASFEDYILQKNPELKTVLKKKSSSVLICFDGLDEIKASEFDITIDKLKDFLTAYPETSTLISCRWHFYKKREHDFNLFDFSVVTLLPFDGEQISEFLDENGISKKDKEKIFDTLSSPGRELIIKTPRYLELLVEYVKKRGINEVSKLNRSELIDFFIYQRLNLEDKRLNEQRRDMFKNVLERLALVMEISQTNVITKEEFIIFLEEIDSASASALVSQDLLNIFYDKSLLVDNDPSIEFENTEFQEYLAAKHLLSLKQPYHNLYHFVVEERLREIHPSWFSTLGYLIELEPEYLEPLLAFGKSNHKGIVEDEQYHKLLTRFNVERLSSDKKIEIFKHVFIYYQNVLNWISYEIGRNLAYYYTPEQEPQLRSFVEKTTYVSDTEKNVQLGNVALLVGSILRVGSFTKEEQEYWKKKLLEMIALEGGNGVLQRHAIYALEQYADEELIDKVIFLEKHKEKLVREQLLDFCISVNPNHPTSIKLFLRTLQETFLMGGYEGLQKLDRNESLSYMLDFLLADENLLKKFIDRDKNLFDGHKTDKILINIAINWSPDLGDKLEKLIISCFSGDVWHLADRSHFVVEVAELVNSKKEGFIYRLLTACKRNPELAKNLFYLQNIFSVLLQQNEIDKFMQEMLELEHGKRIALWTFQNINFSKRPDAKEIYEGGRKYLTEEYKEIEKKDTSVTESLTGDKKIYEEFKFKLMPEEKKYMSDVFDYFNHSEETIKKYWTDEDKARLIELVNGSIFERFDPRGQKVVITKMHDGSKTYTMHSWIHIFGECIEIAKKLKLDISKYRAKIAGYIPYAAYENLLSEILELLGKLTDEEAETILEAYTNKHNDLWKFNPRGLIELAKKEDLKSAMGLLKLFVESEDFAIFERTEALEAIMSLGEDEKYFEDLFIEFENAKGEEEIAEIANEILITKFNNDASIKWRFKQLEQRAKPFSVPEGAHSVGGFESELHSKAFASPLISIKNVDYEKNFLELLSYSFKLLEKDQGYFEYVKYIWEIVYAYFDGRKNERSYEPLEILERFVMDNLNKEGANWFVSRLKELRKAYLLYIGRPASFPDSIGIYNKVKQWSYLPIATNEDLYQKVKQIVMNEIQDFFYSEGNSFVGQDETKIQKQLQTEIQNRFLHEKLEATILREAQAKDNTRCDFLIFYGWLGPILIELKLASHDDLAGENIQSKKSHTRLKQYLTNYHAYKGILLIIDNVKRTSKTKTDVQQYGGVKKAYSDISAVEVTWLKLLED